MNQVQKRITVNGIVQGVGFRPFIYRIAIANGLAGSVRNLGDAGVEIIVQGDPEDIDCFLHDLEVKQPPLSEIESLEVAAIRLNGRLTDFLILDSESGGTGSGTIPPDTAICAECVDDVRNFTRYHHYWATSCVNCGPRFTVIDRLPYDRERTSMVDFPMCSDCEAEYTDPLDRRYHAQTIACQTCGPQLSFNFDGCEDPIGEAAGALKQGRIVAIKGIGGTHLSCDATDERAVSRLRRRRNRPMRPFALMATEEMLSEIAIISDEELEMMRTFRRPIVILNRRNGSALASSIVPGLHNLGVMLPYSGLHYLLFDRIDFPLVMTSANMPGEPVLIENEEIEARLKEVADDFLLHDRRIVARCDDSVMRWSGGGWRLIRRSRGWAPAPIEVALDLDCESILALGPELDVAAAVYADGRCYLSQYIGDVDNVETFNYLKQAIEHLLRITGQSMPEYIACDLHPQFMTTRLAEELGGQVTPVQHHHAHIASVLGEHDLERTVGIALDGIGYGADGRVWGGEVLIATRSDFDKVGGLSNVPMPGGDVATQYPARMVAGILYASRKYSRDELRDILSRHVEFRHGTTELEVVLQQLRAGINTFETSSAGRFLDAVSALLGICDERTYEGEPAMKLESAAVAGNALDIPLNFDVDGGRKLLNVPALFEEILRLKRKRAVEDVAATAQHALARGVARIAIEAAEANRIPTISLSGGVAYNDRIASAIKAEVETAGYRFYTNEKLPCGDGGISFGQVVAAGAKSKLKRGVIANIPPEV
ncbi:MAG: carbamoyltransferase HypF [Candidatus Bipolaricaulia bacterium]